ncbi:MAG: hypothetical protein JWL90_3223 [Chthoniobacteraceae bacterium]|nr:hypothetical protein [Chthoniobacteraceae bacterium]
MQEFPSESECAEKGIPARLHCCGRESVQIIDSDDWLYMRHPPLSNGVYGFEIPEHRIEDQSVNSRKLSLPDGVPEDVLFDTKHGKHHFDYQVARFRASEINSLEIPNPNTVIVECKENEMDMYRFTVTHEPAPCMYPHCCIFLTKNKNTVKKVNSPYMKSAIRAKFAKLAEQNRLS